MGSPLRRRMFRLTGWAAAYVLALHALLFAYAGAFAANAVPPGAAGAAILCLAGDSADGAGGDASHALRDHCAACFTAASALPPPAELASLVRYPLARVSVPSPGAPAPMAVRRERPGQPRAPPVLS